MAKREDLRRDDNFDFDPNEILDEESDSVDVTFDFMPELGKQKNEADDLDDILSDDFLSMLGFASVEEPTPTLPEDLSIPELQPEAPAEEFHEVAESDVFYEDEVFDEEDDFDEDEDVKEYVAAPVPAFEVELDADEEIIQSVAEIFPDEEEPIPVQNNTPAAEEPQKPETEPVRRRKKMTLERIIKEVYLPPLILGLTLILVLTFIASAIGRTVKTKQALEESLAASRQEASSALAQEAQLLVDDALALAAGYNYDSAIALLDTFPGEKSQYQVLMDAYNTINQAQSKIKPIDDPNTIPNLSFHCLIADPARAFIDKEFGKSYNQNYVTTDEFSKILEQLYAKGYVLVDWNSFIIETVGEDGKVTYSTKPIYLPEGKKPIMLTETLVNYETFSIDSNGDGEADKGGDGFASKLVVRNGEIVNEYVDADGNTLYGAYDFVPILENFIKEHPDFCYQGARATLAVSGEDGVFGYRTMLSVKEKKGEDYYTQQVEGAKAIAQALRDRGYTIASYTYANVPYGTISATKIQVDMDNWTKEVKPVLGDVSVIIFAKASDIGVNYDNGNGKYNVLKNEGFRYFISSGNSSYTEVTVNYVRHSRIMVTGQAMTTTPQTFSSFFTPKDVLNELRGKEINEPPRNSGAVFFCDPDFFAGAFL